MSEVLFGMCADVGFLKSNTVVCYHSVFGKCNKLFMC